MENDQFQRIVDTGAKTVRIVKPYADQAKVRDQMEFAEHAGAFGIGMDIDHIFGEDGLDVVMGEQMAEQTMEMLRSYVERTSLPYAVPPMMVLPKIREALQGRDVQIIVDCGIASGADVFKALALGADACAVGRSMLPALEKDGTAGVSEFLRKVGRELRYMMSFTGFAHVADIDDSVLHFL